MGIQAFEPILVEGNAIKLHPLVCKGFNADFDGDQMAVHLPLSIEAQVEAHTLMLATNNIFSPSNGAPIISPSQDVVMGCYYLTMSMPGRRGEDMVFRSFAEVEMAHSLGKVDTHARIKVKLPEGRCEIDEKGSVGESGAITKTTAGRVLFNSILPESMLFL
jgi:DNA-directed RNA polymerase subunit beta'